MAARVRVLQLGLREEDRTKGPRVRERSGRERIGTSDRSWERGSWNRRRTLENETLAMGMSERTSEETWHLTRRRPGAGLEEVGKRGARGTEQPGYSANEDTGLLARPGTPWGPRPHLATLSVT